MGKQHTHNFVAEKYTVQKSDTEYIGNAQFKTVILDVEKVLLFCTRCGERLDDTPTTPTKEKE
jgi:hypothetical protein